MVFKTFLVLLLAIFARSEYFLGTCLIIRPIVLGTLTGLIMGDMQTGIIMGATLELAFIGAVSIGAYIPPDTVSGTILGVAFAIQAGAGPEAALTLGIPIATIMLAVNTVVGTPISLAYAHSCDRRAEKADYKGLGRDMVLSGYVSCIPQFIIIPAAFYFGSDAVTRMLGNIPPFIQTGMEIAGGLIPALGFAMLAQMIMNKKVAPYFFLGYFLIQYLGIGTTGVAIFAGILVAIMLVAGETKKQAAQVSGEAGGGFDEF